MFAFLKTPQTKRRVEVGWVIDAPMAGFVWAAPKPITRPAADLKHAKSVGYCPAVLDYEARFFEVTCPFDINIKFAYGPDGRPGLIPLDGDDASIRNKHLNDSVVIVARKEWRHPDRPIIQFKTPYFFVTDENVVINQMPPICHYSEPAWPGVFIGGRFPLRDWPRHLMWAMEWHDLSKPLLIKRGDPWFYVRFEAEDPTRPVKLIEAEMTPALEEYQRGMAGVTNYVRQTFSLFSVGRERRPKKLLAPKKRD